MVRQYSQGNRARILCVLPLIELNLAFHLLGVGIAGHVILFILDSDILVGWLIYRARLVRQYLLLTVVI